MDRWAVAKIVAGALILGGFGVQVAGYGPVGMGLLYVGASLLVATWALEVRAAGADWKVPAAGVGAFVVTAVDIETGFLGLVAALDVPFFVALPVLIAMFLVAVVLYVVLAVLEAAGSAAGDASP